MFVILTYDINRKRVSKVMKICRKYLVHIQESVFEGTITEGKLTRLKKELKYIVNVEEDSVCIYQMESIKFAYKEQLGTIKVYSHII